MEDCYPWWGNLLPGLLKNDVPAHLWLREKTGHDLNFWQWFEENPAQEENFSKAMTNWDTMVRSGLKANRSPSVYLPLEDYARQSCCSGSRLCLLCSAASHTWQHALQRPQTKPHITRDGSSQKADVKTQP